MRSITSEELAEYQGLDLIHPIGEERGDIQAALVAAVVANTNRDPKKRPWPFQPSDFRLQFWRPAPTRGEIAEKVRSAFAWFRRKQTP